MEITLAGPDIGSGAYEFIAETILDADNGESIDLERTPDPYNGRAYDQDIAIYIKANPVAIGFFEHGFFLESITASELIVVPIKSRTSAYVLPTLVTFADGTFPLSHRIFINLLINPASL
jgi:ABC-type phosphate transport system substrate-binding protein